MPVGTITFPTTIDSDQTLSGAANNVTVLLDQAINSTQTSIAVASTTFFPSAGFATIVDNLTTPTKIEIISYTQISGNTLQSVIRGAQGTTPQSFSTGYVEIRPTAGHHLALVDAIVAIENRLGTGSTLSLTKGGTGRAFTTMPGTDRIFFWDASANSMQLLELGTNLSITGTVLNATGGGVPPQVLQSIGLTMPGIFTVTPPIIAVQEYSEFVVTANPQVGHTVYAGPTVPGPLTPSFRALVDRDIPNALTLNQAVNLTTDGFVKTSNADGTLIVDTNTYVTSVGLSLPNIFTVTNSPVTSSGTLTATLAAQAENLVLVGPINAPAAAPTFRLLEDEDIPNVLTIHKNRHLTTNGFVKTTNGDGTYAVDTNTYLTGNQTITLSGDVTGSGATSITTTIANGAVTYGKIQNISATSRVLGRKTAGAGSAEELTLSDVLDFIGSAAQGDILYRGSTGWARLAAGTSGQYLQTQGAAANPQWATVVTGGTPGGSGTELQFRGGASTFSAVTGSSVSGGAVTLADAMTVTKDDAGTNNTVTMLDIQRSSSGTPASAFGAQIRFGLESTTTANRDAGGLRAKWITATDGSRLSEIALLAATSSGLIDALNVFATSTRSTLYALSGGIEVRAGGDGGSSGMRLSSSYTQFTTQNSFALYGGINFAGNPSLQVNNGRVGINIGGIDTDPVTSLRVGTTSASIVPFRADSAAAPTVDIAQFTINGTLGAAINKDGRVLLAERSTDPAAADLTSGANAKDRIAIYMKNDKLVFAYNDAGTVYYISIPCDGATATTTWTHSTTAP